MQYSIADLFIALCQLSSIDSAKVWWLLRRRDFKIKSQLATPSIIAHWRKTLIIVCDIYRCNNETWNVCRYWTESLRSTACAWLAYWINLQVASKLRWAPWDCGTYQIRTCQTALICWAVSSPARELCADFGNTETFGCLEITFLCNHLTYSNSKVHWIHFNYSISSWPLWIKWFKLVDYIISHLSFPWWFWSGLIAWQFNKNSDLPLHASGLRAMMMHTHEGPSLPTSVSVCVWSLVQLITMEQPWLHICAFVRKLGRGHIPQRIHVCIHISRHNGQGL